MDASTTGAKGSISKRDKGAGARRARVVQVLVMQAGLSAILVALAFFSRDEPRNFWLNLATLLVPIGWGYAVWNAYQRDEAARRAGTWSVGWASAERKRSLGILGIILVAWVAVGMLIFWFA